MFNVGDLVVHPMHGAGMIADIVREKVAGTAQDYYVFQMPTGGLLLKIPVASSAVIGMRSIISSAEAADLLSALPALPIEINANWSKRYQENLLRLKSGDLYEVAKVVKSLMYREQQRGLSTGERKMLHNARQILISELALTVHASYEDTALALDRAMMPQSVSRS